MIQLNLYKPNSLEEWITQKYQQHGIHSANDIEMYHIANIFCVEIFNYEGKPFVEWDGDHACIFLSENQAQ